MNQRRLNFVFDYDAIKRTGSDPTNDWMEEPCGVSQAAWVVVCLCSRYSALDLCTLQFPFNFNGRAQQFLVLSLYVVYRYDLHHVGVNGCTRCNSTLTWSVASFSVIWLPVPLEFGRCRSGDRSRAPLSLVSLVPHDSWPLFEWPVGDSIMNYRMHFRRINKSFPITVSGLLHLIRIGLLPHTDQANLINTVMWIVQCAGFLMVEGK